MTAATSRKTHLHAIMISRCQDDDIFVAFQPMEISVSGETGNSLFSKDV